MALFKFNFGSSNSNSAASNDTPQVIQLALNDEVVTISAAEASGRTIQQLFDLYASDLGDTSRISRFVAAGQIVNGGATPQAGTIYRGAVGSETKG